MTAAVVIQLFVGDLEVRIRRMIGIRGELAAKPEGANVGRVLEPRAPAIERGTRNGQCKFARLCLVLANSKHVFASQGRTSYPTNWTMRLSLIEPPEPQALRQHHWSHWNGSDGDLLLALGAGTPGRSPFGRLDNHDAGDKLLQAVQVKINRRALGIRVGDDSQTVLKVLDVETFREGFQNTASF